MAAIQQNSKDDDQPMINNLFILFIYSFSSPSTVTMT